MSYKKILGFILLSTFFNCDRDSEPIESPPLEINENLIFAVENFSSSAYLIDMEESTIIKRWDFESPTGKDIKILEDGRILGMFEVPNVLSDADFGGWGGMLRMYDTDGNKS